MDVWYEYGCNDAVDLSKYAVVSWFFSGRGARDVAGNVVCGGVHEAAAWCRVGGGWRRYERLKLGRGDVVQGREVGGEGLGTDLIVEYVMARCRWWLVCRAVEGTRCGNGVWRQRGGRRVGAATRRDPSGGSVTHVSQSVGYLTDTVGMFGFVGNGLQHAPGLLAHHHIVGTRARIPISCAHGLA